ncbi:hypothetical protein V6O07_08775, partial [Arthrospira platensis SPKY2]
ENDGLGFEIAVKSTDAPALNDAARSAVEWTLRNGKPSGAFSDTLTSLDWRFEPIEADGKVYGVLGLYVEKLSADLYRGLAINIYVHQLGLAWFRTQLAAN